jgi:hypothetical protein
VADHHSGKEILNRIRLRQHQEIVARYKTSMRKQADQGHNADECPATHFPTPSSSLAISMSRMQENSRFSGLHLLDAQAPN